MSLERRLVRESPAARRHLARTVALGVVAAALVIASGWLLAHAIVSIAEGSSVSSVGYALMVLAALFVLRGAVGWAFEVSGRIGAEHAMSGLRARLVEGVLASRPVGLGARSGEVTAAAVRGVDDLDVWFSRYLPQVVLSALVPAAVIVAVAVADITSALVLLITVPLVPLFMVLIGLAARERAQRRWEALAALSGSLLDLLRGMTTLRANNRVDAMGRQLEAMGDRYRRDTMKTLRLAFLSSLTLELVAMLGVAMVAVTVGVRLAHGGMAFEAALIALILAPEAYQPLRQLGAHFHAAADGRAAAERIFETLDLEPAVTDDGAGRTPPDPRAGALAVRGVRFRYPGSTEWALWDVSLTVAPGEHVTLVGPNGSGKSTLAALICRLVDPVQGSVSVGDVDLRETDLAAWRRHIAWVPQRPHLFSGSLRDNVALGAPACSEAEVLGAIEDAGLAPLVRELPDGIETAVGQGGIPLSGGERQRVALARALLSAAEIVILDEPFAHLDSATAERVRPAIERLVSGRTALTITHHPEMIAGASRVVRLDSGRVVSDRSLSSPRVPAAKP